jgi:CHAD domain-containing protein
MRRPPCRRAQPGAVGVVADRSTGARIRIPLQLSLPRFLSQSGYRVHTSSPTRRSLDLFDTGDRRLAASGAELSLHRRDGWRWRRDALGHPKLASREWTAPPEAPQQQLMDWTRAYRRGRPVAARASVAVHRRNHRVGDAKSEALLTLVEERTDEQVGTSWAPRLRHVSVVEADDGGAAAAALAVIQDTALDDAATLALLRPALVRVPRLKLPQSGSTDPRDLFTRSSTLSLIQWLYFDCELSGGSPEALRKVRVALRRLRSDLQTFAPLFDRAWADALREQLGDLATSLGVVRDAEVLRARLSGLVSRLPEVDQSTALPLLDTAGAQLSAARAQLLDGLARDEYLAVLNSAVAAVTRPRWIDGECDVAVARLARRPWRRLRDYIEALDGTPDDSHLHRVRILAKRARYAADACVPAVGDAAATSAARLADLQTVLGDHHDAVVTREWLHRQAVATSDVSFVAGQLAALELIRVDEARGRWRDAWGAASRRQDWRWLRS